ncbi:MAG: FeoB-associated Cys-rich membrane protein [Oscillospiraceae bacterium]|nr:FeoB-associated Cys-rich membrane protein [Oscillospiraceae bacterium]
MSAWLSANLINIVLIAVLALVVGLLIRGMIRDRKAGKSSCGGNCAACGACGGCSGCARCGSMSAAAINAKGKNRTI